MAMFQQSRQITAKCSVRARAMRAGPKLRRKTSLSTCSAEASPGMQVTGEDDTANHKA